VHTPFETGKYGQFISVVHEFLREFGKAKRWDGLLTGFAFFVEEEGKRRAYFRWQDLRDHMDRRKYSYLNNNDAWMALREYAEAESGERKIKGISVRWWSVSVPDDLQPSGSLEAAENAHF
jgi:hypothetical protein